MNDCTPIQYTHIITDVTFSFPPSISIREVGPRDGLQIEAPISTEAKLEMVAALAATGVRRIEATSFVSQRAVPALADAEAIAGAVTAWPDVRWSALVASINGARRAIDSGILEVEYVISASDEHSKANVGRSTEESIALVDEITSLVHSAGGTVEVIIGTAWDCPFGGPVDPKRPIWVADEAVIRGADVLCLADTIGTTTPLRVQKLVDAVRDVASGRDVGAHFHNTRGTGIANALAAVLGGVTSLDASVGGLGGCPFAPGASGNIATEELVYMLENCGVETGIDLDLMLHAVAVAEAAVGHELQSSLYRAGGQARPLG
jgi:hydroxymethylglutaryl-CoA lyase